MFIKINKNNFNFIMGIIYISPTTNIEDVLNILKDQLCSIQQNFINYSIILCGDFNSRIASINNTIDENILFNFRISCDRFSHDLVLNTRGKILLDFMESSGFYVINGRSPSDSPAQYTHVSSLGKSVIDLIWVNDIALDYIDDLKVVLTPVHSDHFPLILTLQHNDTKNIAVNTKTLFKWREDLSPEYSECMAFSTMVANVNLDVQNLNNNIEFCMSNVASQIGMIKRSPKFTCSKVNNYRYNERCKSAKKDVYEKLNNCKVSNFDRESLQGYLSSKLNFKNTIKLQRDLYKNRLVNLIANSTNPKEFWDAINANKKKIAYKQNLII